MVAPMFATIDIPPPRRAHTTVLDRNKVWVLGWLWKRAAGTERRLVARQDAFGAGHDTWVQVTPAARTIISPVWYKMSWSSLEVAMGASTSKAIDSSHSLYYFFAERKHTSCEGLLIASKDFLRVFTDAAQCCLFSHSHTLLELSYLVRSFTYISHRPRR